MATVPTNNPIPSEDPSDLKFNAGKIDEEVNGSSDYYIDRFGAQRLTNTGRNNQFQDSQTKREYDFQQFLLNSGYQFLGDYESGPYTIDARNQIIRYQNEFWRLNASTMPPYTTTGINVTSWAIDVTHLASVGDAALRTELASINGATLSLSQVATAYGLDFSLGGVWQAGATSSVDNWWWYNNKIYTGGSGNLPSIPSAPWYPIRPGHKLNLTDFITSKGTTDILDVVDWQWAFDSAALNIAAGYSGVIEMDAREYQVSGQEYVIWQGVGLEGPRSALFGPDIVGCAVLYITTTPSAPLFYCYGAQTLRNFGMFYATQEYNVPLASLIDMNVTFYFKADPKKPSGSASEPKGNVMTGISACGCSQFMYAKDVGHVYNRISDVLVNPSKYGASFHFGLDGENSSYNGIKINANVIAHYRPRYGNIDWSARAYTLSDTRAIGFQFDRVDGVSFTDICMYGVPFANVFGTVGPTAGTQAVWITYSNCIFDATASPFYINSPASAGGINIANTQIIFDGQYGDTSGNSRVFYLGAGASNSQIMANNLHVSYTNGFQHRLLRATSGSSNNRVIINNSSLSSYLDSLDEGVGNRLSVVNSTGNLNAINLQTNVTLGSTLLSSLGELNTMIRQSVNVSIAPGATYTNLVVTYPYAGWVGVPNVKTEIASVSIAGQGGGTVYGARCYSRTPTGCTLQVSMSTAAVAAGSITVDLYIIGTVRGSLVAV